jgi:hypothetical protein
MTPGQTKGQALRWVVPISEADRVTPGQTKGQALRWVVPISEADRVTPGQTKETGTLLRSGASPLCLARSENETALDQDASSASA